MKKISILFLLFIVGCGYQPLYLNKNLKNFNFKEIIYSGDNNINRRIINSTFFNEDSSDLSLNTLEIKSIYKIEETSKNLKGQVETFRSYITVTILIKNEDKLIKSKKFLKEFNYSTKENKFELNQYHNDIKEILANKIIEEIFLFMSI